jgi:hypothetical protein
MDELMDSNDETVEHLEKLTGGAIRRATVAIWWKKGVPQGNGAARRRGGDLVGVRDAMVDLEANGSVSPTGMARGIFGRSRRPRSPSHALGFDRVRQMKNHPVPDEKSVWGHGWAGF